MMFWSSSRGRTFPVKSWDEPNFRLLARSQFSQCPNGDYVWTYRFFESAMCGAIPIVEDISPVYEGFRFRTMADPVESLIWTEADAQQNGELCKERHTIPPDELNLELAGLLAMNSATSPVS